MDEHLRKVDHCGKLKSFQLIIAFRMEYNQARILKGSIGCSLGPLMLKIAILVYLKNLQ